MSRQGSAAVLASSRGEPVWAQTPGMALRTSLTHPLRIDEVPCSPQAPGVLGVTFCPGKCGDSVFGAPWKRDLDVDVQAIRSWGARLALTLIEQHELESLQVAGLGEAFKNAGIEWAHLPIRDLHVPDEGFHAIWLLHRAAAVQILRAGGKVLVHCRGGLGRAGTVACMLLIELGASPPEALARVRNARPGAVETQVQEHYVHTYKPAL